MTDSTMIERVARAIAGWTPNMTAWEDSCNRASDAPAVQAHYHGRAIAAIKAMRNPTPAMLGVGQHCEAFGGDGGDIYRAMIDAALQGEG